MTYQPSNRCGQSVDPLDGTRLDLVDQTVKETNESKKERNQIKAQCWGSERTQLFRRLSLLARNQHKVWQSLSLVCLRLSLMAATWFQFSKWPALLPDVNRLATSLPQYAQFTDKSPNKWCASTSDKLCSFGCIALHFQSKSSPRPYSS